MRLSSALIGALAPVFPELKPEARATVAADVRDAVTAQLSVAPWHMRFGLCLLGTSVIAAAWLLAPGRGLGAQSEATRRRVLGLLDRPGTPTATLLRAWRSLIALAWLEHPFVLAALAVETGEQRQRRFRAARAGEDAA